MNTRVGTTGAVHRDRSAFEARERVLEQTLNRVAFGLPLPADEACAVVCEREFQISQLHA
jgi:hypothetical protein